MRIRDVVLDKFGEDVEYESGSRLINLCGEHEYMVADTFCTKIYPLDMYGNHHPSNKVDC